MASRSTSRSNVLAGIFLLVGVALAVAVSMVLSGATDALRKTRSYTVLFSLADGASGIKPGAMVLLGGQPIGKVRLVEFSDVAPTPASKPGAPTLEIAVHVATKADFTFYTNAEFFLERPLLGSLSTINIASIGNPAAPGAAELPPGGSIRGRLAPPSFLAQAGVGTEQIVMVQEMITDARKTVARLNEVIERNVPRIDRLIADADDAVHEVRTRVPTWSGSVDTSLANVEGSTKKLGPLIDSAHLGVDEAREVFREAGAIVDDGSPKIAAILDNAQSVTDKLNRESIEKLNAALTDAQGTLQTVSRVGNELAALMREQSPNIRRVLANARLASDQLKLAMIEIRSQPWRLLYTPGAKETESSILYDAARNYAEASSDLRAASESLEAASGALSTPGGAPGAAQAADRQSVDELTARLKEAASRYKDAERALLDRLISRGGASAHGAPEK